MKNKELELYCILRLCADIPGYRAAYWIWPIIFKIFLKGNTCPLSLLFAGFYCHPLGGRICCRIWQTTGYNLFNNKRQKGKITVNWQPRQPEMCYLLKDGRELKPVIPDAKPPWMHMPGWDGLVSQLIIALPVPAVYSFEKQWTPLSGYRTDR